MIAGGSMEEDIGRKKKQKTKEKIKHFRANTTLNFVIVAQYKYNSNHNLLRVKQVSNRKREELCTFPNKN